MAHLQLKQGFLALRLTRALELQAHKVSNELRNSGRTADARFDSVQLSGRAIYCDPWFIVTHVGQSYWRLR